MPVIEHKASEYQAIRRALAEKNDSYFDDYVLCSSVLDKFSSLFLTQSELAVLRFIIGRTLLFRKRAESIYIAHFSDGVFGNQGEQVCAGCGLGKTAIRQAIRSLQDKNYVTAHSFCNGRMEHHARLYEVNTAQIVAERDTNEVAKLLKRPRKLHDQPLPLSDRGMEKMAVQPLSESDRAPYRNPIGLTLLDKSNRYTSTDVEDSATAAPTRAGLAKPRKGERKQIAINVNPGESPQELAVRLSASHSATRITRAASAKTITAKRWSQQELQALLDKAREAAKEQGYAVPRIVVVAKNAGVLHKRLLAAQVGDCLDFFTWALCNWSTVASANRRSKAAQAKETKSTSSAMAMAPNFNDLAFRCTYILAFYNDREFTQAEKARTEAKPLRRSRPAPEAEAARVQRRSRAVALDRSREAQRRREEEEDAKAVRRPRAPITDDDDDIPAFKEKEWRA